VSKNGSGPAWRTLRINGPGHTSRVQLDGEDISSALTGMRLHLAAGSVPTATLELALWEAPTELDAVRVMVPDETRELLVRLGWTPPAEEATS
jgi:hypothetical protein